MGKTVFGMIAPHPPVIVPEIGGKRAKGAENTKKALESVCKDLKKADPDVIIIITPHGEVSQSTVHIYASPVFDGDFGNFGFQKLSYHVKGDEGLAIRIKKEADSAGSLCALIPETNLDHGILVPYHYVSAAGIKKPVLPIAISLSSLKELFVFGKSIKNAVEKSDKKIAIIASADMSHRLTPDAPAGFSAKGKIFDDKLVALVKAGDVDGIIDFDPYLAEEAGQDALWSIAILLGAVEGAGLKQKVLSYEGPFGVGYMVSEYA